MRQLKIGTSSVRGIVNDTLTPELIVDFSCAFAAYCDDGPIVIGRDTRRSSPMLRSAVLSGLLSSGRDVVDLGICTTPLVSHAIRRASAAGGIVITGSHNDARWNALKFVGPSGALLNAVNSQELLDIYHARAYDHAGWDRLGSVHTAGDEEARYVADIVAQRDVDTIRRRGFRVAVDFCNGAATTAAHRLLEALGCALIPLNPNPAGDFAHAPAPSPANMAQMAALMPHVHADIGAVLNIDGDRVAFVTADGAALSEEYTLPLVADHVLERRAGPIVTNLSTSRMIDAVASRHKQGVIRTAIGEATVIDTAVSAAAAVAGEGSGMAVDLEAGTTFDGLHSIALVLEALAQNAESLTDRIARLPQYTMRKGAIACPPNQAYHIVEHFRRRYPGSDITDGVRATWPDAWLHVRASNTEPLLRVIVEADTAPRAESVFEAALTNARRLAFGQAQVVA